MAPRIVDRFHRFARLLPALLLAVLLWLPGCADEDDSPLHGSWGGVAEEFDQSLGSIRVVFASDGDIDSIRINGGSLGLTAQTEQVSNTVFRFRLSNGSRGAILTDGGYRYAAFIHHPFRFAILQRNASGPNAGGYVQADLEGTWGGRFARFGSTFGLSTSGASAADVTGTGVVGAYIVSTAFTAAADITDGTDGSTTFGAYGSGGSYSDERVSNTDFQVLMSPNKTYAAAYGAGISFPADYTFSLWAKQ